MEAKQKTEFVELHATIWADRFNDYLIKKEYSSDTIRTYMQYINIYLRFTFGSGKDLAEMVQKDFDQFIDTIPGATAKSMVQSVLRTFYKFTERKFGTKAPVINMDLPRPKKSLQYTPKQEELEAMRKVSLQSGNRMFVCWRDHAIFEIFLATGIREAELRKIKIKDIGEKFEALKINGKGRKQRWVILSKEASDAIFTYLEYHENPSGDNYLFYGATKTKKGETPISHSTIVYMFDRLKEKSGVTSAITPHGIRRTFATKLAEQGIEIHLIRQLLGHNSIQVTSNYINSSMETVRNSIKGKHPFNKPAVNEPNNVGGNSLPDDAIQHAEKFKTKFVNKE